METLEFKPSIIARIFGQKHFTLRRMPEHRLIRTTITNQRAEDLQLKNWRLSKNLFSQSLQLFGENNNAVVSVKIAKSKTRAINQFLFETLHKDEIEPFCSLLSKSMSGENYFPNSMLQEIKDRYSELIASMNFIGSLAFEFMPQKDRETVRMFVSDEDNCRAEYNNAFVESEATKWEPLFRRLEDNPLTEKQIESVVTEEDATLVVAGAGTGKTSSVVGKIGYLLHSNRASPKNILALAFNRDAASEMRERVLAKTGKKIEIRTFHSFGKSLIEGQLKEKLKIADFEQFERAKLAHVNSILSQMYDDGEESNLIVNFLSFHRYPAKFREDFSSNKDYLTYMSKIQPVTLNDEWVKSFEEVLVADWLTIHGVKYEYEKPYEHKTGSRFRRQYQPDFYLSDYGVYLEHFGIDKQGNTATWINKEHYNQSIEWKRSLHRENHTELIETYSWERMDGVLSKNLKQKLELAGIKVKRVSNDELKKKFETKTVNVKLVSLIKDFLSVFKEGQWQVEELRTNIEDYEISEKRRFLAFVGIFEAFLKRYSSHLINRGELDFSDLIARATEAINAGKVHPKFTHIIVDEFQDISRGRSAFLRAVRKSSGACKLMCVGDDWQSIYGFTGSDVHITTKFDSIFGAFKRVDLDRTFRFRQPLIDISSRFIQQNRSQLKKQINGREATIEKEVEVKEANELNLEECLLGILKNIKSKSKNAKTSVLVLGRYNFTEPDFFSKIANKYNTLTVNFMTVHKSKGLQADYVIILGLENAKFGFPGSIANDPIMNLVRPSEDDYEDAEERRVLYVALTRAKEKVFLIKPSNPSKFLDELMEYDEVEIGESTRAIDMECSTCYAGVLTLKFPNRVNGYAWHCSYGRYCGGKAKFCSTCNKYPEISGRCANKECVPKNTGTKKARRSGRRR